MIYNIIYDIPYFIFYLTQITMENIFSGVVRYSWMASFIPTSLNIQCLFVFFWRKWGGECIWKAASNPLSLFQFTSLPTFQVRQAEGEQKGFATYSDALKPQTLSKLKTDVFSVEMAFGGGFLHQWLVHWYPSPLFLKVFQDLDKNAFQIHFTFFFA